MKRALIACPNLSLDRTIRVERAVLGSVHRSIESDVRGGGKGVNVARALKCMGREALVVGFSAGRSGHAVLGLLEDEGIDTIATDVKGETRSCLTVLSEQAPTVFNESGPRIDDAAWERFESTVAEQLDEAGPFVFSGSLPPGAPAASAAGLIERARTANCTTICDTSGTYLEAALVAAPDIVKPNLSEALALLGEEGFESMDVPANALERAREAAVELRSRGPKTVIVTAGPAGVVYATEGETRAVKSPEIEVVNPVGAGDCFVAGLIMELSSGAPMQEVVLSGVAMGAAGCETFAAGVVDPDRVRELRANTASSQPAEEPLQTPDTMQAWNHRRGLGDKR
ncbi:1-phosphofructokinase family hexose kinase [soil metagenome]